MDLPRFEPASEDSVPPMHSPPFVLRLFVPLKSEASIAEFFSGRYLCALSRQKQLWRSSQKSATLKESGIHQKWSQPCDSDHDVFSCGDSRLSF